MHERKKIAFVINNLGMGGAENMLFEQVKAVDKSRFEPYIVTILPNPKTNILNKLPPDVKYLEILSFYKLWLFFRQEKIYAVVTSLFDANLYGRLAAILARLPVILSSELNVSGDKKKWQVIADNILARFTKKILVSSNDVLDFTSKQEHLPKSKFELNFNAIPLVLGEIKKNRDQVLRKYSLPEDYLYIVTAGSLTLQKAHTYLIDAVYQMKQNGMACFKVLIFGRGVLKDELSEQIHKLDLVEEVKLMGIAPIEEIMAISDIFTLPSLWEGLSIALLQAMDARCPIVATKISGTSEALEDKISALLVDPGEVAQLSEALERVVGDPELRQRLAEGAKKRVEKFSIGKNVKVIENLIWP